MHLRDEVLEHLLADLEICDDAVLERTNGLDVRRCPPDHALGFGANGEQTPVPGVDGDDGWLVEHDATATHVHDGVRRAEVDGHVTTHEGREDGVGHAGSLRALPADEDANGGRRRHPVVQPDAMVPAPTCPTG